MDIRNCKMCGNIYQHSNLPYCPNCLVKWEDMFLKVRDYIWDNSKTNVSEVAEKTGVEEKIILEFLRDGRIELKEESVGLPCEKCDAPIRTGRYCEKCSEEIKTELKRGVSTTPKGSNSRQMHTADRIKKRKF